METIKCPLKDKSPANDTWEDGQFCLYHCPRHAAGLPCIEDLRGRKSRKGIRRTEKAKRDSSIIQLFEDGKTRKELAELFELSLRTIDYITKKCREGRKS